MEISGRPKPVLPAWLWCRESIRPWQVQNQVTAVFQGAGIPLKSLFPHQARVPCAQGISATGEGSVDAPSLQGGCKIHISDGCKCSGLGGTAGGTSRAGPAPCSFQPEFLISSLLCLSTEIPCSCSFQPEFLIPSLFSSPQRSHAPCNFQPEFLIPSLLSSPQRSPAPSTLLSLLIPK